MPETIIESVLSGKIDIALFIKWLGNEPVEDSNEDCVLLCCNRSEFVVQFLSYLRNQTDNILQTNTNAHQVLQYQNTPEKIINSRRNHHRSISDPTSDDRTMDNLSVKTDRQRSHESSPSKDRKRAGRKVKTKLFTDDKKDQSVSSDESRLSYGLERIVISSTPLKNGVKDHPNLPLASPVTPRSFREYERCDTPRLSHRHSRSHEKNCLGDYLVTAQKSTKKKKVVKNISNDDTTDSSIVLDLSNSEMFPEIGVRKSSSLRSERRRIKPTNIDKPVAQKSYSLNSFTSECFQQPSPLALEDNVAFKQQSLQPKESANTFEVERNMLKQERHKLMEKFNILNTSTSCTAIVTPQIKVSHKDSFEKNINYIKSDCTKIVFKDKIDILIEIYNALLKNNLILSVITEIYFLISILLSKQIEDDYVTAETNLSNNNLDFILKSIHNCTYFAVKSLWAQRVVLEVILDKNSLKILGENKKVRSFYPDLAKFLLNSYGLKCEAENNQERKNPTESRSSNGVICFNLETDNIDNFPTVASFQNFKKQRDMFYQILGWYQETQTSGGSRTTFRARIKTLLTCGQSPANYAHLATLFTAHMLSECLPQNTQESKMSKLQRRLTCPTAPESHRLPYFSVKELFYKEFIMYTENESFRVHLRDAFASEIIILDSTPIAIDDRTNVASGSDISREYLQVSRKLNLLAKFLGFVLALPYTQVPLDSSKSVGAVRPPQQPSHAPPKERVLENNLALRNYSQPSLDLKGLLINSYKNSRISITIPWLVHYLSQLDYTTLRLKYYQELLKIIFNIYTEKLKLSTDNGMKKNTIIYLKSILGWLFDLPHFPMELFYEKTIQINVMCEVNIDCYDVIDESMLFELCPFLKDVNVLLSTCRVSHDQKEVGSFRHITPVSLSFNTEDRIRNKEKELQSRLEEEFLRSQPSSWRRVLELVVERVTAGCVRELAARPLAAARARARARARAHVAAHARAATTALLESLQGLYLEQLQQVRTSALETAATWIRTRSAHALAALLPAAPPALHALAVKGCLGRLRKWIDDNWTTTAILCKDIEAEMKALVSLGECASRAGAPPVTPATPATPASPASPATTDLRALTAPAPVFHAANVSPAPLIIHLKEQICLLLEDEEPSDEELTPLLANCATSCSPSNLFGRLHTQRAILQLSVDLCIVLVTKRPDKVTEAFLLKVNAIWNTCCPDRKKNQSEETSLPDRRPDLSPDFRNFEDDRAPTPVSDDDVKVTTPIIISPGVIELANSQKEEVNCVEDNKEEFLEFFERVLCPRNIVMLSHSKSPGPAWSAMATFLVFLLHHHYLSEDSLTEQCLAVYRQDWPQNVLESLSTCMKSVSSQWSRSSTGKFNLFLDFLAEYCGDMEYEPME